MSLCFTFTFTQRQVLDSLNNFKYLSFKKRSKQEVYGISYFNNLDNRNKANTRSIVSKELSGGSGTLCAWLFLRTLHIDRIKTSAVVANYGPGQVAMVQISFARYRSLTTQERKTCCIGIDIWSHLTEGKEKTLATKTLKLYTVGFLQVNSRKQRRRVWSIQEYVKTT